MAIDPVCGMQVDEKTATWKAEYKGRTYFFCAPGCRSSFEKDPERYLDESGNPKPQSGGMMHPA